MRRILVDHARRKQRVKHGGDAERQSLDVAEQIALPMPDTDVLALHEALERLEVEEPPRRRADRKSAVLRWRLDAAGCRGARATAAKCRAGLAIRPLLAASGNLGRRSLAWLSPLVERVSQKTWRG